MCAFLPCENELVKCKESNMIVFQNAELFFDQNPLTAIDLVFTIFSVDSKQFTAKYSHEICMLFSGFVPEAIASNHI